jgi:phosphoglycolate phosphatase
VTAVARLLAFDLDGTLVDSSRDIAASVNAALARVAPAAPEIPLGSILGYVGDGARQLVERCLRHLALELSPDDVLPVYLACYEERLLDTTRVYPGVEEALAALEGTTLAVLTNKPGNFSRAILEGLGVARRFARIWGAGDVATRKPDPEGLVRLMAEVRASPAETWMVGDSAADVGAARAAGARCAGVTWGFHPDGLRAAGPDLLIDDPRALASLAAR